MRAPIHVVGGGFSGLTIAYFLVKQGRKVIVHEKESRLGGLIYTEVLPIGQAETAANGLLASALVEKLFQDLDLTIEPAKKGPRFIFREGVLRRWPLSLGASLRFLWFILRLPFSKDKLAPRPGESISAWALRTLNKEFLDYLLKPALQGIYAGDTDRMSASLILGRFFRKRNTPRGRYRGTIAPQGGMGRLIEALEKFLRANNTEFIYDSPPPADGLLVVATSLKDALPWAQRCDPVLAEALEKIPTLPLTTATAFWPEGVQKILGFGVLFPPQEGVRALGVLANPQIFSHAGPGYNETWIYGGASDPHATQLGPQEVRLQILADRKKLFPKDDCEPSEIFVKIWPHALPHYTLELEQFLQSWEQKQQHTFFTGNYWGALGLSAILERNQALAERIALC